MALSSLPRKNDKMFVEFVVLSLAAKGKETLDAWYVKVSELHTLMMRDQLGVTEGRS